MADINDRQQYIINQLSEHGNVSVSELSKALSVSEVTIRSNLSDLEEKGLLVRTHGGAVTTVHPHILARQNYAVEEKTRIAKAAAALINNNDTIMIEAGTTAALIPRYLAGKKDIHIITNSLLAFKSACLNPTIKITVTGGEYCNATESFTGSIAAEIIQKFNVKYAFVGTDGFSTKAGITTHYLEAAQIIKVMRERAEKLILVSDSSKYNNIGAVNILPLSAIDVIISDSNLTKESYNEIKNSGCKIELV